ncbi:MAG: thermonuclease family protein [Nitrosopumilus sp.]
MILKLPLIIALFSIPLILIVIPHTNIDCSGNAMCLKGKISNIIDGNTIDVGDVRIILALTSTSELGFVEGDEAKIFVENTCPIGSDVLVDEDDGQIDSSYGRIIGKVICQGINLNEEILEKGFGKINTFHCKQSEFSNEPWAKNFGC